MILPARRGLPDLVFGEVAVAPLTASNAGGGRDERRDSEKGSLRGSLSLEVDSRSFGDFLVGSGLGRFSAGSVPAGPSWPN